MSEIFFEKDEAIFLDLRSMRFLQGYVASMIFGAGIIPLDYYVMRDQNLCVLGLASDDHIRTECT